MQRQPHLHNVSSNPPQQQPQKTEKSDKAFLSKKEVAPCLIFRPDKYSAVIRARDAVTHVDILPISLRDARKVPLREINGIN